MRKFFKDAYKEAKQAIRDISGDDPKPPSPPPGFQQSNPHPPPQGIRPLSAADVFRYRYHHGVNFGSVYVLEKWLSGHMFEGAADWQSSELEAVRKSVERTSIEETRQKWEVNWSNMMEEKDWDWLVNVARCTSIRLPIGYFSLGPRFCRGTPFEDFGDVYVNCWASIRHFIQTANSRGIGVLIDLHALPGGANPQEHSGTNTNKCELWDSKSHQQLAFECLQFIAVQVVQGQLVNVIGIQVLNEADHSAPDRGMHQFYDAAIATIGTIDPTLPVYVSDAWNLEAGLDYSSSKNKIEFLNSPPVVIDTHVYFCFGDEDKAKSPQQIIADVPGVLSALDHKAGSVVDRGAAEAVVGEYSCVLDGSTWDKSGGADRDDLVRQFGQAESRRFQQRAGGAFFWTLKMDWMPGGEWGFVAMTDSHAIVPPQHLGMPVDQANQAASHASSMRDDMLRSAFDAHVGYWSQHSGDYDHEQYRHGWQLAWSDAEGFWRGQMGPQRIGMVDLWVLKRCREYSGGARLKSLWEWEQGFRRGIQDFERAVGCRSD